MLTYTGTIKISEADYTNKDLNLRIFHPNKLNDISVTVELVKQYQTSHNEVITNHIDVINTLTYYTYSNSLPSDFDSIEAFILNKLNIDFPNVVFSII